ncbi:LPS export ABC transporter periplasmic protein LptC [Phyllobacterium endophyticum]|jgi:lipopolysaccharide export system protein LptC|uniref:LPS export ABC transporter periplasmic protein LptC n=1 Tax=Phyllobacterium endophyticum TaxID=1149773 RepID=A0A2P7B002_9HYPH|nr:LPS export ABC transporter periplasmic protein LptC [Phyllobacterium endophyticum]MBB3235580.1 lipopolysaccharide export system protein LptC [Phyllobacterium endophyticum]PSH59789.1 LPS export ABC transporter periplasmic protein LptC [Phyllobacterium endophyticum]TYR41937.1 LPS export ABC transporter periplasmic protein LptC [Phyllobacterium endophyticum]
MSIEPDDMHAGRDATAVADHHAEVARQFAGSVKDSMVFRAAERHSRRVRFLKFALPAAALAGAAVFSWFTFFSTSSVPSNISLDNVGIENGMRVMTNPNLDGFTKDNLPYKVSAVRALQEVGNNNVISLEGINAKIPLGKELRAEVTTKSGVYDNANQQLKLDSAITLTTSDGITALLQSATIDMAGNAMSTDDPVSIKNGRSSIAADSMRITESGKVITFEKRVRLVIQPAKLQEGEKEMQSPE